MIVDWVVDLAYNYITIIMSELPETPVNPSDFGVTTIPLDFQTPVNIEPGQTDIVIFPARIGGEPEVVHEILENNARWKKLMEEYGSSSQVALIAEYQRIHADFELYLREETRLQAIRGVLVEKYGFDSKMLAELNKK
jgi:hypothetical protein